MLKKYGVLLGSFFRGLMTTTQNKEPLRMDEDSPYVLYGRETTSPGQYKVTVADLETGLQYHLDKVQLRGELRQQRGRSSTSPECISSGGVTDDVHSVSAAIPIGGGGRGGAGCYEDIFLVEHSCPAHVDLGLGPDSGESLGSTPGSRCSPLSPQPSVKEGSPLDAALLSAQFSLEYDNLEDGLQFTANMVHRGQKADMIIQQLMAGSKLKGTNCVVLVGPLHFSISDTVTTNANMAWSM
jgi:hypothetical protein